MNQSITNNDSQKTQSQITLSTHDRRHALSAALALRTTHSRYTDTVRVTRAPRGTLLQLNSLFESDNCTLHAPSKRLRRKQPLLCALKASTTVQTATELPRRHSSRHDSTRGTMARAKARSSASTAPHPHHKPTSKPQTHSGTSLDSHMHRSPLAAPTAQRSATTLDDKTAAE